MSHRTASGGLVMAAVVIALATGGCDDDAGEAAPAAATLDGAAETGPADAGGGAQAGAEESSGPGSDADAEGQDDTDPALSEEDDAASTRDRAVPTVVRDVAPTAAPEDLDPGAEAAPLVEPALQVQVEALAEPDSAPEELLVTVAGGAALGAIQAQVLEYDTNGWSQVGAPTVVSAEVVSVAPDADPARVEVLVCLDHAEVDVVDAEGVSLVDDAAPSRVLQLWRLEDQDGRWVVVEQTFTDETRC